MHVWVLTNSGYNLISSFFTKIGLDSTTVLTLRLTLLYSGVKSVNLIFVLSLYAANIVTFA